ncbi:MAG: TonB-dependent receptor [Hyphomonas sp.]
MWCFRPLLLGGLVFAAPPAMVADPVAPDPAREQVVTVNLSAQPLSAALNAFAAQSGIAIVTLAPPGYLGSLEARSLQATGPADQLLAALLADTGIRTERSDMGVYILTVALPGRQDPAVQAPTGGDMPRYLEPVIVPGSYFASIESAAERERLAASQTESIDALGIGEFPAQNVAEALQRVTGVTVLRDRGEALFVGVRGLPANFQTVTLNGTSLAVNENVRDSGQDGRQFRFDVLPTDLVSGVDVVKAPTAAMEEGAIGATINVRTFRPLELPAGALALNASISRPQLTDRTDHKASAIGSWKSPDDRLGVLTALSYNERSIRQDRITLSNWDDIIVKGNGPESISVLAPISFRPTLEQERRDRLGINSIVQFAASPDLTIDAEAFYVRLDGRYREWTLAAGVDPDTLDPGSFQYRSDTLVGLTGSAGGQIGYESSDLVHDNLFLTVAAKGSAGDIEMTGRLSFADARSETADPITRTRVANEDIGRLTISVPPLFQGLPDLKLLDADLEDPGLMAFRRIEYRRQASLDQDISAQFDLRKPLAVAPWAALSAGAKLRERHRDYIRRDRIFAQNAGDFFPADFFEPFPVGDFLSGAPGSLPRRWLQPRPEAFAEAAGFVPDFEKPSVADLRNSYKVSEAIQSVYVMADVEQPAGRWNLKGNLGLRVSRTRQTAEGHAEEGATPLPVSFTTEYIDVLPSANLHLEMDRTLSIRASLARAIVRPSLADLAPRLTLNSSGSIYEAVGGNPSLKRYEAWQGDLAGSFTPADHTSFSAGIFYKSFDSFVFDQITDFDINGRTYQLTAPTNGGQAEVYGVELALRHRFTALPAPWDGLGIQANYTWADSKATYSPTLSDKLENVARGSYALSGIFEQGPARARIVYTAVGNLTEAVGSNDALSANAESFHTLDAILGWRLSERLELSLEAQNLNDEVQYLSIRDDLFGGYTRYGRTFAVSLRYRSGALAASLPAG